MKFLSHSNGLHTVEKEKLSKTTIAKRCLMLFLAIIAFGFVVQFITNMVDNSTLQSSFKYGNIDGKKMEYRLKSQGSYTVVFDGEIGANLYQWEAICNTLDSEGKVGTFTYNRSGYGFNDGNNLSIEDQAKALKKLLKKAGASEPYILVGEEYGSLVLTNFAKLYPDSVAGVVLIEPIKESDLVLEENIKLLRRSFYRSKFEAFGCNFSLTSLLDKMNLTMKNTSFIENLGEEELNEFEKFENKSNYKSAVSNEIKNLYYNVSSVQEEGLLNDIPLYIISEDENNELSKLGNEKTTVVYKKENMEKSFSMVEPDIVITGINNVVKQADKKNKNK